METTCASLFFEYPEALVAIEPQKNFRTLFVDSNEPRELTKQNIFELFKAGDLLVLNNTKVNKQRVFSECDLEILFIKKINPTDWEVLFPAKRMKAKEVSLPGGVNFTLEKKGLPQTIRLSKDIDDSYFQKYGELALPPYIQKVRGRRNNIKEDEAWYQTAWAERSGSVAAPTASLHFSTDDLNILKEMGVQIEYLTLHVGLGTFLPIRTEKLSDHKMHTETCEIPKEIKSKIEKTKSAGNKVWALGTTVTRSLESIYSGHLSLEGNSFVGETDLFITPGFEFKAVDCLMTNFHQPGSTLLALVGAFAGLENVLSAYGWAIKKGFKLFSYGDLSIWHKKEHG